MKSGEKKFILVLLVITVIVGIVAFIVTRGEKPATNNNVNGATIVQNAEPTNTEQYVQELDDGSKLNVSEELRKTKTLDGLEFTNIQLKENGGITNLLADVENKSGTATSEKKVKITILDQEGKTLTEVTGTVMKLAPGAKTQLNASVTADVANAYDFKISNK